MIRRGAEIWGIVNNDLMSDVLRHVIANLFLGGVRIIYYTTIQTAS